MLVIFSTAHAAVLPEPDVLISEECYSDPDQPLTLASQYRVSQNNAYQPSTSAACDSLAGVGVYKLDDQIWPTDETQTDLELSTSELQLIKQCFPVPSGSNTYTIKFWVYSYNGATMGDRPLVLWVSKDSSNNVRITAVVPPVAGESDHYAICRQA